MNDIYSHIICIHPEDESTSFLSTIGSIINQHYLTIPANEDSHSQVIETIAKFDGKALIIFLGHGSHSSLFGCCSSTSSKSIFLDSGLAEKLFNGHDILLVSCNSADFLRKQGSFASAIGFGNIISSMEERNQEAEYVTGVYRDIDEKSIAIYNECFAGSLAEAVNLLACGKISFPSLFTYLLYFFNKKINRILLDKNIENRIEIAKLLFETKSDLQYFYH